MSVLRRVVARDPLAAGVLGALVAVRVVFPLVVLAESGSALPGFPRYVYAARAGDSYGYYAAVRELLATVPRLGIGLLAAAAAAAVLGFALVRGWRRRRERAWLALVAVACISLIATLLVLEMRPSGAVTIGWPFVWSLPLLPYRALGLPLDPDIAFGFGLALSLLANAVTVVATYALGLWASGRRAVGLVAAALFGLWPLVAPFIGRTPDLGTWQVDLGLSLYSEPLSTALVVTAVALVVRPQPSPLTDVLAGALLGFSVTVRLSNAVIAAAVVAVVALAGTGRRAIRIAAAGVILAPIVIAYWPMGYPALPADQFPEDPFGLRHAVPAWRDSTVWGVGAFLALVPLAAVGAFALPRAQAALLGLWVFSTAAFYTFYRFTPLHPRFLLVALPAVFVLWAAGATAVVDRLRWSRRRRGPAAVPVGAARGAGRGRRRAG